ncbi:unknown [Prevotella sp. CAG:1124]|nr:unknown [Prevotella sp. CAG:1124]
MTREEELLAKIQEMCDQDLEADVIKMIDALPDGERTYKVVTLFPTENVRTRWWGCLPVRCLTLQE